MPREPPSRSCLENAPRVPAASKIAKANAEAEAVRERLDCSEAFAKQVVRQKAQRRASTALKTSPTEDDYAKPRVQLRATSKRQRGLPA